MKIFKEHVHAKVTSLNRKKKREDTFVMYLAEQRIWFIYHPTLSTTDNTEQIYR